MRAGASTPAARMAKLLDAVARHPAGRHGVEPHTAPERWPGEVAQRDVLGNRHVADETGGRAVGGDVRHSGVEARADAARGEVGAVDVDVTAGRRARGRRWPRPARPGHCRRRRRWQRPRPPAPRSSRPRGARRPLHPGRGDRRPGAARHRPRAVATHDSTPPSRPTIMRARSAPLAPATGRVGRPPRHRAGPRPRRTDSSTSPSLWEMKMTARPSPRKRRKKSSRTVTSGGERFEVGSSRIEQLGPAQDRLEDLDPLLETERQVADACVRVDLERHSCGSPRGCGQPPRGAGASARRVEREHDVVRDRHRRHQHEVLVDHADAGRDGVARGAGPQRSALERDVPGVRRGPCRRARSSAWSCPSRSRRGDRRCGRPPRRDRCRGWRGTAPYDLEMPSMRSMAAARQRPSETAQVPLRASSFVAFTLSSPEASFFFTASTSAATGAGTAAFNARSGE